MHIFPASDFPVPAPVPSPDVSVIVVNYNGRRFLDEFFASMRGAFERYTHETIVVDNASTDGSAEWLAGRDDVRLILLRVNTGFTGGNNVGARVARGRVLLLINNDTRVTGPLDALVDAALDPAVGAAGCQLRYGDGRLQCSIGLEHTVPRLVLSWLGLEKRPGAPSVLRKYETNPALYAEPQPDVAWVSGACLATRRDVWQRLGGLDGDLFMYCEDVDYCRRAREARLRIVYTPTPVVIHYEGGGKAWPGVNALLRTIRAYYLYTLKNHGRGAARALGAGLAFVFSMRFLAFRGLAAWAATGSSSRATRLEKAQGFARAAGGMAGAAWSGRVPPLP